VLGEGTLGFADLDRLAAGVPAGANGVLFTPWLAGARSPVADKQLRASFLNLSLATTQADLVRSVLEGVALHNRWLLAATEKFVGRRLDPIRLIGGGAVSDLWAQIHADVLDRTIEQVDSPLFAGLRGAALQAAVTLGELTIDEVAALSPIRATFRPDGATRAVHDERFDVFAGLYGQQKKLFHRLNPVG
jgi:xylulokinase